MSRNDPELEALLSLDPDFARIVAQYGPPPSRRRPPGFATLARAIVGQQVSTASAAAIWQRLSEGLARIEPETIARRSEEELRALGLSRPKARYVSALAEACRRGELDVDGLVHLDDETVLKQLVAMKGIGHWTAEIYLLMALGRPDIWPAGDLALMIALQELKQLAARPDEKAMRHYSEAWRPHRSAAARLLWHFYGCERGRNAQP